MTKRLRGDEKLTIRQLTMKLIVGTIGNWGN